MTEVFFSRDTLPATTPATSKSLSTTNGGTEWPKFEAPYADSHSIPTYSSVPVTLASATSYDPARKIAIILASLFENMEPLGAEFQAAWDESLEILYEYD